MLNLLPQEEKTIMIKEYNLRLAVTVASFACILVIIAIVGLFPSYISQKSEMQYLLDKKTKAEQSNSVASLVEAEKLSSSNKVVVDYLAARVAGLKASHPAGGIIAEIFAKSNPGITIEAIEIVDRQVIIRGKAATRADLIAFHSSLRTEANFKNATLPIGDIAKSTGAGFSIQITLP